jgi:hypothetical protein
MTPPSVAVGTNPCRHGGLELDYHSWMRIPRPVTMINYLAAGGTFVNGTPGSVATTCKRNPMLATWAVNPAGVN